MTKTLHTLVQEALRAESTTENRYAYVDYYLGLILEIAADNLLYSLNEDDLPF